MTVTGCHKFEPVIFIRFKHSDGRKIIRTEYAEVTYTVNNKPLDTLTFDTSDMDIICCKAPSDDYTVNVVYYGVDGTKYE